LSADRRRAISLKVVIAAAYSCSSLTRSVLATIQHSSGVAVAGVEQPFRREVGDTFSKGLSPGTWVLIAAPADPPQT
jgi:hypothetical protein